MDIIDFRDLCLSLPLCEETTPFDETTLVYKVEGKMFAMADMDRFEWINCKCQPQANLDLRDRYRDIVPAYHMNKVHWNSIRADGDLPDGLIRYLIKHSYLLVISTLTRQKQLALEPLVAGIKEEQQASRYNLNNLI